MTGPAGPSSGWHGRTVPEVLRHFDVDAVAGLPDHDIERRRAEAGPNDLEASEPDSPWPLLARQFTGPLSVILVVAAAVSAAVGEPLDAAVIAVIVVLNGVLGFVQEWRASQAIEAMTAMLVRHATVRRSGTVREIEAVDLVPGDVVELSAGDQVPADLRIVEATDLAVDESALTGESAPVRKGAAEVDRAAPLAERSSMVHVGTHVRSGRAAGVVTATGRATEFGTVVSLTESADEAEIPLQRTLARLGRTLGLVGVAIAALTVAIGIAAGRDPGEMVLTGISLAVAVVPEGLPAVVTLTLGLGIRSLARSNALLRRLEAAETLGAASVICTDKTGTLTQNRMTVTSLWQMERGIRTVDELAGDGGISAPAIRALAATAVAANHAAVAGAPADGTEVGDPTEVALLRMVERLDGDDTVGPPIVAELPFDSDRKMMAVVVGNDGDRRLHVKGAPEVLLERVAAVRRPDGGVAPLTPAVLAEVHAAQAAMASRALRTLALASGAAPAGIGRGATDQVAIDTACERLVLEGVVGMHDPPRPEVADAVEVTRRAGIDVIMMTGDAGATALAIAHEVGLPADRVVTGNELDELGDDAVLDALDGGVVLARVAPEHKLRVVRLLQGRGEVVAMTGDGVNDAPALEQASIGVAMGLRGTDVAREAADVVLTDDNFASIVLAVGEGRRQFANIKKFIRYLLSSNLGEVVAVSGGVALGWPLILAPAQILWMNLVTDGATALALGLEGAEPDAMDRPPRHRDDGPLGRGGVASIVAAGVVIGLVTLVVFHVALGGATDDGAVARARTMAFTVMVLLETVNVLNFRAERQSLWRLGLLTNPLLLVAIVVSVLAQVAAVHLAPLARALGTAPLTGPEWLVLVAVSVPLVVAGEAVKAAGRSAVLRRTGRSSATARGRRR